MLMLLKSRSGKILMLALMIVLILSGAHALNVRLFILVSLSLFILLILLVEKSHFLPLMLFFLPWSPVLKLAPGTVTFYTLAVPMVFLVLLVKDGLKDTKFKLSFFILPIFLIVYMLSVKLINGYIPDRRFIFFVMMLFFIPYYAHKYKQKLDFEICTLFLSAGVITACVASKILVNFPHMLRYIDVYEWEQMGLTRLSGFYGDANFYSAHILVAVASLLITMRKSKNIWGNIIHLIAISTLVYFGMLSVSKMFILSLLILFITWIFIFIFEKREQTSKFKLVVLLSVIVVMAAASNLFSERIEQYLIRFSLAEDSNSLTTGRSKLMEMYMNYLLASLKHLFLGMGLSSEYVNGRSSHNTFIQLFYQLGILGVFLIIAWWRMVYTNLRNWGRLHGMNILYFCLILIGTFFPWMALEMLYFDEFFYITLFVIVAKGYLSNGNMGRKTELRNK